MLHFFQVRICIHRHKRSSEPKIQGRSAHKKPLVLRVKRYPINMAENNIYISLVDEGAKISLFLSVKRVMLSRFKVKIFCFFLELLEFSEDRSRWESVEEKLNAIRYG